MKKSHYHGGKFTNFFTVTASDLTARGHLSLKKLLEPLLLDCALIVFCGHGAYRACKRTRAEDLKRSHLRQFYKIRQFTRV